MNILVGLVLLFSSLDCFAVSKHPPIKSEDRVEVFRLSGEAAFYKCSRTGEVIDFKIADKKGCEFVYLVRYDDCKSFIGIVAWYCGRGLKVIK